MNPQTITRFSAQNIQRLHAVTITPDGELVVIGGENAQGKTSVLDSIEMALCGKDAIGPMPVRRGESKASIVLETQDLIVTRTFSPKGSALTVKGRDGRPYSSPQTLLDSLYAAVAFDPLAFSRMKPTAQREELRRLVGVDFADLDTEHAELYSERTGVNREFDAAVADLARLPFHQDAPLQPVDVASLQTRYEIAVSQESENRVAREVTPTFEEDVTKRQEQLAQQDARIADLEQELVGAKKSRAVIVDLLNQAELNLADHVAKVAHLADPDVESLRNRLATIQETNAKVAANAAYGKAEVKRDRLQQQSEELTESLKGIDAQKTERLEGVTFPVPGLSISDDGVTMNGIPFEQASEAEKLRVSVAMGIALHPTLRVLLIRDGSLLDKRSLALVGEMAASAGAQVWIERVGDGQEVQVVIEDGNVKEDRTKGAK